MHLLKGRLNSNIGGVGVTLGGGGGGGDNREGGNLKHASSNCFCRHLVQATRLCCDGLLKMNLLTFHGGGNEIKQPIQSGDNTG